MSPLGTRLAQVAAQVPAGASVLDVGCSDGRLLAHLRDSKGVDGRGWLITGGILLILGAVVIWAWPSAAVSLIFTITGIVLIIVGISEIVGSFQIKKLAGA